MEKDFNKEISNSEDAPGENAEDKEIVSIGEEQMKLIEKKQSLQEQIAKKEEELYKFFKSLKYFEDSFPHNKISQLQTSLLGSFVSPIGSPIHKSQNLSEDTLENLPDSTVLAGSFRQPDIVSYDPVEALEKQSKDISTSHQSLEEIIETRIKFQSNSPPKTSNREAQASGSDTRYKTPQIIEEIVGSGRYYVGKGKEAANPIYRYKKRSKTNVSSCESSVNDSPVKCSEEAFNTPESKTLDSQSSKVELTRISPAMKRKGSDSKESDLDESCARTSVISKLSENPADDDLKITKKLKFDDDEKIIRQYPTLTELLSQKNYESIDLAKFMDQPQTDQTSNERERLILPSTSGLSNVVGCSISNSEESSLASGIEDELQSERGESSLTSVSGMSPGERGESPLTSVSEDTFLSADGE